MILKSCVGDRREYHIPKSYRLICSHKGRRRGNSFSSYSTTGRWSLIPCLSRSRPICGLISEMALAGWLSWPNISFTVFFVMVSQGRHNVAEMTLTCHCRHGLGEEPSNNMHHSQQTSRAARVSSSWRSEGWSCDSIFDRLPTHLDRALVP